MKKLSSFEIRNMWLDFWRSKGHDIINSAPLIPINDPTLLWINSGVASLKRFFDGSEIPQNRRMANAQKSIRTNDIENVGKTARHHTFFEMLGNFSVGDYFRDEALEYAMEILTSPKWFNFPLEKLYFTVYPDDEASIKKWISLGVDPSHIFKLEGNYWEIGEGPSGPNTEIFYDRGEDYDLNKLGLKLMAEDISNDRYIEIWNIVFSQYNAEAGKLRSEYIELPSKNIDTGMGLERMACIIQKAETNYETDLFYPIIEECVKIIGTPYNGQMAYKVISDHIRTVSFALSDGASFSNEGRGYVLRRLLRRALRFSKVLGNKEAFLYRLVDKVIEIMHGFYPNLEENKALIIKQIKIEEEKFLLTLEAGEKRLLDYMSDLSLKGQDKVIDAKIAFLLYDTFGFPLELSRELAEEGGFKVDEDGFYHLLEEQRKRARSARINSESMHVQNEAMIKFKQASKFIGYDELNGEAKILALFKDGVLSEKASGEVSVVFDQTPFYAESGGQIGDVGLMNYQEKNYAITSTTLLPNGQHLHHLNMGRDELVVNKIVRLMVDEELRLSTARNHSVTHLLNQALREKIGPHIVQQGSFVGPDSFRFDFNNYNLLSNEELLAIEQEVNQEIKASHKVKIKEMTLAEAKASGAQALFGEKYADVVRVIDMDYSQELCGGTHVANTREIERFAILSLETKGSGIYRLEGATANNISRELDLKLVNINKDIALLRNKINDLNLEAQKLNFTFKALVPLEAKKVDSYAYIIKCHAELANLREYVKDYDKGLNNLKRQQSSLNIDDYLENVQKVNNNNILIFKLENVLVAAAKDLVDNLSERLPQSLVFVGIKYHDKLLFICKSKVASLNAGSLVKEASIVAGGNGGGRSDFAQAGARDITKLDLALNKVKALIGE